MDPSERNPCGRPVTLPPLDGVDAHIRECSNHERALKRCPEGNRVERTKTIYPKPNVFPKNKQLVWQTTYQNQFVPPRNGEKPAKVVPELRPWRTEIQFYRDSVYRSEYQPFPLPKKEPKPLEFEYSPPCQPMNASSSYNRDYPPKFVQPARTTKKQYFLDPCPPPMDDQSSYKMAFVQHPKLGREPKKTQKELQTEYGSLCLPFDATTTYKRDFLPTKPCPSKSMRPGMHRSLPLGKFDDRTVYRGCFEPFYYDDGQFENCIPYYEYDNIFPPNKDKCADVCCFPEVDRTLPPLGPALRPTPPCPPYEPPFVCPSSQQARCGIPGPVTLPLLSDSKNWKK